MAARAARGVAFATGRTDRRGPLHVVEKELYAHCAGMEGGEASHTCWMAYEELERRKKGAEARQVGPARQRNTEDIDHLEQLAREFRGMPSRMVRTLQALASSRDGRSVDVTEAEWDLLEKRLKAEQVFRRLDRDGNGVLDPAEFREGMHLLDEDLDGRQVQLVFRALETNGFLQLEEFLMIAEATDDMSHESRHAHALRHMHLHPSWWTDSFVP